MSELSREQVTMSGSARPCFRGDGPWLRVRGPTFTEVAVNQAFQPEPLTGKWMLFTWCPSAPTAWKAIRAAVEEGRLGIAAKVAIHARRRGIDVPCARRPTAAEALPASDVLGGIHAVIVYTRDWRDIADVRRVGNQLLELGVVHWMDRRDLLYKADAQTRAGIYSSTSGRISLYRLHVENGGLRIGDGLIAWAKHSPDAAHVLEYFGGDGDSRTNVDN